METIARYAAEDDLTVGVAERLIDRLLGLQAERDGSVHLCLTGGWVANRMYEELSERVVDSGVDLTRLEFWWGDERFVPTEDPDRHAGHTLSILARSIPLSPARTHSMPSAAGIADAHASASAYARELGDTAFDICLLGIGRDGHVASLFPGHPGFTTPQHHSVIGVVDAPLAPEERISLTVDALSRSHEVWFLVSGPEKADAVARSRAGDPGVPAGVVRGTDATRWFVDAAAAADLPYYSCRF